MELLAGSGRKAALFILLLSVAGWITFVVAFGWQNATTFNNEFGDDSRRLDVDWFSFWGFGVGGLVFYLLAFPYLIFGQRCIGILSNLCVTFVLVTAGGVLYIDGRVIRTFIDEFSSGIHLTDFEEGRLLIAEFAGCFIAVLFVGVYMMAWPTYSDVNNSEHNTTYPQALPAVAQYPSAYAPVSNQLGIAMQPVAIGMQQSYTRATIYPVAVPVLLLSAVGWLIFIVAFGWLNDNVYEEGTPGVLFLSTANELASQISSSNAVVSTAGLHSLSDVCPDEDCSLAVDTFDDEANSCGIGDDAGRFHERWLPYWGFAIATPLFYTLALPHLIFGQWYIGILSNFCAAFLLASGGGILYIDGTQIRLANENPFETLSASDQGRYLTVEFAGCFLALFFVAVYMVTWPFYTDVNNYECVGYESPRNRRIAQLQTTNDAVQYPTGYAPVPNQLQPMQPMQPVYPVSGTVPPQGV